MNQIEDVVEVEDIDDIFWVICEDCGDELGLHMCKRPSSMGLGLCDICDEVKLLFVRTDYLEFKDGPVE